MESAGRVVRIGMHFADVDAMIACLGKPLDPGMLPGIAVAENTRPSGIFAVKERRARGHTGRRHAKAVVKYHSLAAESVEIRCYVLIRTERRDRIKSLLVGHN